MNRKRRLFAMTILVALLLVTGALALAAGRASASADPTVLEFDVAQDHTRFVSDETPVHDDGLPAYGNEFVTQGYLYPAGTLDCSDGTCNGALADGSPEFPNLVLGEWSCWGHFVGDGAHTQTGPVVVTTQNYSIGETPGARTVVTAGYELADIGVPFKRAIVGGTGVYQFARGQQTQTVLGVSDNGLPALRVELTVRR
ncbi:MAG: hypothetical protein ACRDIB_08190 [Ardenticatenaceae bacterium]